MPGAVPALLLFINVASSASGGWSRRIIHPPTPLLPIIPFNLSLRLYGLYINKHDEVEEHDEAFGVRSTPAYVSIFHRICILHQVILRLRFYITVEEGQKNLEAPE